MKYLTLIIAIVFSSLSLLAQDVPERVKSAFNEKYAGASDVEWEVDKHDNFEAHFKYNGKKLRADYSRAGDWIETEESVSFDSVPAAVKEFIKKYYPNAEIVEVEKVDSAKKGSFYDVEIKSGGDKMDVALTAEGRPVK